MNNKTEIDYLNYNDLNLVEEKIKECTDRANEAMSPQINKVIDGKSTQETRSGKNLFDINNQYKVGQSFTYKGITITYNENGYITLNGTASANGDINIVPNDYTITLDKDIYLCFEKVSGSISVDRGFTCEAINKSGESVWSYNAKESAPIKKVPYSDIVSIHWLRIAISTGIVYTNYKIRCWVSTENSLDFELFGAMPSPDYPSEIENVKWKNLINPNLPVGSETKDGITLTNNGDGTYTVKGTATKTTGIDLTTQNVIKLKGNTYYTNSIEVLSGTMDGYITVSVKGKDDVTKFNYLNLGSTFKAQTKKAEEDLTIVRYNYYIESGKTVAFTFRVQLEEGSVATRYVPYGNIQIVETGDNLWQPYSNTTFNGITLTQKNNGNILLNGTATGDTFLRIILNKFINEATTLSCNYKSGTIKGASIFVKTRTSKLILNHSIIVSPTTPIGIKLEHKTAENYYQEITIQKGAILSNVLLEVMFLKGTYNETNLPDYKPYTEEVVNIDLKGNELCSLPNGTKDELIVKDGRAKIIKKIDKVVLDGSDDENWLFADNNQRFRTNSNYIPKLSNIKINKAETSNNLTYALSNYYIISTQNDVKPGSNKMGFSQWGGVKFLYLPADYNTVDKFKTWLSTHNVTIQYELVEPYEIDLGPLEVYFTYETKKWVINELPYIQEIDRIEKGIYNLGEKYNRPKGWLPTKEWITKDNLYPIKGFDYRDWNRWVNNLNIFTTDIVVKDTIWNGASFINWEQIGKDEWR